MGTFLKVLGILTVLSWVLMAVGCAVLGTAIQTASKRPVSSSSRGGGGDVLRAMQDGQIEANSIPSDIRTAPEVTITMRDGSRHTLRDSAEDRLVRAMLAARADQTARLRDAIERATYPSANEPHFKPGEPMVNPNPSSQYDD